MSALLEVDHIAKSYGGDRAVKDVSLRLVPGELLALIGPNGAGKSTTFNMLSGQIRPDKGAIRLEGRDVIGLAPRRIWRLGVGRTFQITETLTSMSVRENIQMALISHHHRLGSLWASAPKAYAKEADTILALIGMQSSAEEPCGELAYGNLKRLELAIALANAPKLLLMDEPTAGMAPKERVELMRLVAGIARERKIGVLFTEHDMDVVFEHADRLMVLNRGLVIAEGTPAHVRNDAQVRAVYLGEGHLYDAKHNAGDVTVPA